MAKTMLWKKAQIDINWMYIILTILFLLTVIFVIGVLRGQGGSIGSGFVDWFKNCFGAC